MSARDLPSLVIFDCDGVLVDSETVANVFLAEAVTALGLPTTTEDCHRRYRGLSMLSAVALIEAELGRPVPEGWAQRVRTEMKQVMQAGVAAIPGVHDLAGRVGEAGIARCVASSSDPDYLRVVLGGAGLDHHFGPHVFSATMVKRGKPAPDLFLHAAATMGHAPETCLVIEDTVPGVKAATAAGMRVIGYAGDPYTDADALASAGATVVTRMDEAGHVIGLTQRA